MSLKAFENQAYLNLETFRKNGQGVKTPVWFAQEGQALYLWTQADSGKAKRVRNNPRVNIVPARGDGTPLGEWGPANASRDDSVEMIEKVRGMFAKKYGLAFHVFAFMGKLRNKPYTTLKIDLGN